MKTTKFVCLMSVICSLITACSTKIETRTITGIEAVFFHEDNRYTLFIIGEDSQVVPITFDRDTALNRFSIYKDVPVGHQMWAYVYEEESGMDKRRNIAIHVHSIDDINGAGWNHGKFGRGTTTKIAP